MIPAQLKSVSKCVEISGEVKGIRQEPIRMPMGWRSPQLFKSSQIQEYNIVPSCLKLSNLWVNVVFSCLKLSSSQTQEYGLT